MGIPASEFWAMTPAETALALEAAGWHIEQERRRDAWLAWHTAALVRVRRMPALQRLMPRRPARRLRGQELERRRREHGEIVRRLGGRKG